MICLCIHYDPWWIDTTHPPLNTDDCDCWWIRVSGGNNDNKPFKWWNYIVDILVLFIKTSSIISLVFIMHYKSPRHYRWFIISYLDFTSGQILWEWPPHSPLSPSYPRPSWCHKVCVVLCTHSWLTPADKRIFLWIFGLLLLPHRWSWQTLRGLQTSCTTTSFQTRLFSISVVRNSNNNPLNNNMLVDIYSSARGRQHNPKLPETPFMWISFSP